MAKWVNKLLYITSAKNALLLILNNKSNRGQGLQLNSYTIIAIRYRQSFSIVVI